MPDNKAQHYLKEGKCIQTQEDVHLKITRYAKKQENITQDEKNQSKLTPKTLIVELVTITLKHLF